MGSSSTVQTSSKSVSSWEVGESSMLPVVTPFDVVFNAVGAGVLV